MAWGEEFLDKIFYYAAVPITIVAFVVTGLGLLAVIVVSIWATVGLLLGL